MIIDYCHIPGTKIIVVPAKANPPLIVDADRPLALTIPSEFFYAVSWGKRELRNRCHTVQQVEFSGRDPFEGAPSCGAFSGLEKLLCFNSPKPEDHVYDI